MLEKQHTPLLSLSENQTIIKKVVVGCEVEKVMDVELQILKHLKRDARPTVSIIDQYCSAYNDLFSEVRSYECFKYLHQGMRKQGFLVVEDDELP